MSSSIEHWHHDHCSGLESILKGGELIRRQQAIDALRNYLVGKNVPCDGTLTCRLIENEVINKLPSAEEESFEWCTDCKEYDQEAHCCHRWSKMIKKTVEEMQIVRCIDCQHSEYDSVYGDRYCHYNGRAEVVDDYHFCRDGERREDG